METPHLIVGLGNPGREYAGTRHNAGFLLLDRLAARWGIELADARKFRAHIGRGERGGSKVLLCQPQTYMNDSGEAVGALAGFHKIPPDRILVAVDDADLPLGTLRLRPDGSSGGHHGLESVEAHLGTRQYARLRVGIGRRSGDGRQIAGWVLAPFQAGEQVLLEKVLQTGCEQIECWLSAGTREAMNRFNGTVEATNDRKAHE